jgi:hypothetical protein
MHKEVRDFVWSHTENESYWFTVEIGSRYINGDVRDLVDTDRYHGIDVEGGKGVDEVADGTVWEPDSEAPDLVLCLEVFEHFKDWEMILKNVSQWIDGKVLVTCAATTRRPHSAVDGGEVRPGEFYKNLTVKELKEAMVGCGFKDVRVEKVGDDLRASGVKTDG